MLQFHVDLQIREDESDCIRSDILDRRGEALGNKVLVFSIHLLALQSNPSAILFTSRNKCIVLRSYLLYEIIELQIPQNAMSRTVKQLFNLPLSRGAINRVKATEADRYEGTYRAILDRVVAGSLVHADETKVAIDRKWWIRLGVYQFGGCGIRIQRNPRSPPRSQDVLLNFPWRTCFRLLCWL